jgi:Na+/H+ antiporter NhaD/arsenite permease-like protein
VEDGAAGGMMGAPRGGARVDPIVLTIFGVTYVGLALGRLPLLAVDRTGIALLGATAVLATGRLDLAEAKAAVDAPTLMLLFGMMVLSAQYRLSGLYTAIGRRLMRIEDPRRLMAGTIAVAAALSAVLTNDIVCFALAPLLCEALQRSGRDPLPYLLALAAASNLGSAATAIGNPQNILNAQRWDLPFGPFFLACAPVALLALVGLYALLRGRADLLGAPRRAPPAGPDAQAPDSGVPLDPRQAIKAVALTVAAIALFLTPVPAPLTALGVAGVVLASRRMRTRPMLALVDWHLLALFGGLFVVLGAFEKAGGLLALSRSLAEARLDLADPGLLVPLVAVVSNLVSNVPAVLLLLPLLPAEAATGHQLALASTFAGNALLVGSIANLIVAEQAARHGVTLSFRAHLRVGLPLTLLSLALVLLQAWLLR